jgi:predicted transcriptional regulator of viral defense system
MDIRSHQSHDSVSAFLIDRQSQGRYTFSVADAEQGLRASRGAIQAALRRAEKAGRIATLRRGFFVIVPVEYSRAGGPPASWFVDDLMRFLGRPYYVGLLTAAALHGAAHQQPVEFQVVTDAVLRRVTAGRAIVAFFMRRALSDAAVATVSTETGYMRVSSPETTALDLVAFTRACGGLSSVATVLAELAEHIDAGTLGAQANERPAPVVQRLGYLLDLVAQPRVAEPLLRSLAPRRARPVLLDPGQPRGRVEAVSPWRVVPNAEVEVDL